jgi:hypothetical protein
MKVLIKGSSTAINLSKGDFLASGGEGSVYVKGDVAYKIYTDPAKMIPEGKIADLASISDPNVIRPKDVICDERGKPLGYTMRYVSDTMAMCQLFPRSFREREGLGHDKVIALVQSMRKNVADIHKAGVLIVDLNEMNVLVSSDFKQAFWIDVDSYQTKHYPATAIMPSVRDPLTSHGDFTELSDWFSFGILAFQLFIGIHPFKGKHPSIKSFEDRMKAGVSVFDSSVSVPKVCYPMDVIPEAYRSWFKAVFQDKKRLPPPTDLVAVVNLVQQVRTMVSGGSLNIQKISWIKEAIRQYFYHGNKSTEVIRAADGQVWVGGVNVSALANVNDQIETGYSPVQQLPVVARIERNTGQVALWSQAGDIPFVSRADELASYDGRLYIRNRDRVLEVILTETQHADGRAKIIASTRDLATVMERASKLFSGGVLQDMLGSTFVSLFPRSKASYQVRIPELDTRKVMSARFDGGVLMAVAAKNGKYSRFIFRFADDYQSYDVREVEDITPSEPNFVTLDSGVCVCLTEDENLELFSSKKGSAAVKVVEDKVLGNDMRLVKRNGRLGFTRGETLFEMRMK